MMCDEKETRRRVSRPGLVEEESGRGWPAFAGFSVRGTWGRGGQAADKPC